MAKKSSKSVESRRSGEKFPHIPFSSIQIVERPEVGQEHNRLFYNPRQLESFTPEAMDELLGSICRDGLQQPLVVRSVDDVHELIAGERRLRTIQRIIKEKRPCYDEDAEQPKAYKSGAIVIYRGNFAKVVSNNGQVGIDLLDTELKPTGQKLEVKHEDVYPTVDGSVFYQHVPCRVVKNCSDERALRLAFTDNDKHKPFQIREEILLVERLLKRGLKQGEIKEVLGVNETWVSHTLNFRDQLPKEAFSKLVAGEMTRNVAVHIMSYKPEDREALYKATVKAEEEETQRTLEEQQELIEREEDGADLAEHDEQTAANAGDSVGARKAARKAQAARRNAGKAREKKDRAASEAGTIRQSHVQRGAAQAGITPKKAKILPSAEIASVFVEGLEQYLEGDELDPICGEEIPAASVALMRATAEAIIRGERDPLKVLRSYMVDQGHWTLPDVEDEEDLDDEEKVARRDAFDDFEEDDGGDYDASADTAELEQCFGDRFDDDDND